MRLRRDNFRWSGRMIPWWNPRAEAAASASQAKKLKTRRNRAFMTLGRAVFGPSAGRAHDCGAASVLPPCRPAQENRSTVPEEPGTFTNARSVDSPFGLRHSL